MEYIFIGLLSVSILLLLSSFFVKDSVKEVRNELDQLSMQNIQELYQIKRKLKVLEEELLLNDAEYEKPSVASFVQTVPSSKKTVHAIIKNQVISLAQQGLSIDQICKQSSLSQDDVEEILNEQSNKRGYPYE
ncbi:hypothetical protein SM124_04405 (plasmid) [Bacillus sp. 31A1R]|uniref:DUF2802 domain-containing protein n=1 Tax=Robertmurraya mangrovi TaxID=3098077 RepID=A0ABU5IV27_9BACI|nr:hypothetical protein [Bacillus sp. 31A1R]MDZ5470990.1 hypothetical protein [Bacillus sp. 31A1R]